MVYKHTQGSLLFGKAGKLQLPIGREWCIVSLVHRHSTFCTDFKCEIMLTRVRLLLFVASFVVHLVDSNFGDAYFIALFILSSKKEDGLVERMLLNPEREQKRIRREPAMRRVRGQNIVLKLLQRNCASFPATNRIAFLPLPLPLLCFFLFLSTIIILLFD